MKNTVKNKIKAVNFYCNDIGPLHMSPVYRAGSVTEMKLVSVHMVTFSPLSEMKSFEKVARISLFCLFKQTEQFSLECGK